MFTNYGVSGTAVGSVSVPWVSRKRLNTEFTESTEDTEQKRTTNGISGHFLGEMYEVVQQLRIEWRAARLRRRALRDRWLPLGVICTCLVRGRKYIERRPRVVLAHQQAKTGPGPC
jgi:hypothetical protein